MLSATGTSGIFLIGLGLVLRRCLILRPVLSWMSLLTWCKKDISPDMIRSLNTECLDWHIDNNYFIHANHGSVGDLSSGGGINNHSGNRSINLRIDEIVAYLTTELIAIRSAVRIAIKLGIVRLVIFTDSLVSCKLLKNNSTNNFKVSQIIRSIESSRLVSCHFVWVPSHVRFQINERAD